MSKNIQSSTPLAERVSLLSRARRIVVKVGSAVLTDHTTLAISAINNIVEEISYLTNRSKQVVLVSSGAVAAGRRKLPRLASAELSLPEKQAVAAIGQSYLMQSYEKAFAEKGKTIAQILLTHSDLAKRDRYLNVRNTLFTLLQHNVIPIVNENDTVSVKELRFGDNDMLAAYICNVIDADLFICLTDVAGLFTENPRLHSDAKEILMVEKISSDIEAMVDNTTSALGSGGMLSKIKAAHMVVSAGGCAIIGGGRESGIIRRLFEGEPIGTFFLPDKDKRSSRKRWIDSILKTQGTLILDEGACRALLDRGKSLLPSGVVGIEGHFVVGDAVRCVSAADQLIAIGLINYDAHDTSRIMGRRSDEIAPILGYKDSDELIHRDNMVIKQERV
ncbi:MAG: glutamate 5-kinase [Desulfofustis sp. PB-SRB1]|jgi:glutamate 5-kinase|nr:glutamate 5-kinase [Desulfofustis sp. PB-SRB1]MBM1001461.1 glutamate 5-kinase [Desulfofustis sp. PB-SRB1]HBH28987.1 glutamate 5-kinase [Desulfofustis sp.]HBH31426.1 glutamate 5-kinase [Desulfofustis sp.]